MKKVLLVMMFMGLSLSLIACNPNNDNTTDPTTDTTNTTEGDEQVIDHPDVYFDHDFTYLFIEGRYYKENPLYYEASNFLLFDQEFEDWTGLLDVSFEAMYMKGRNEPYSFIQFDPNETELVLSHLDDDFYQVSLRSNERIHIYEYNGSNIKKFTAVHQNSDGTYVKDLYRVHKEELNTDYGNAFVLYNLSSDDLIVRNETKDDIDFRGVFDWEDNEAVNLQEFSNSYLVEDGERYDHGFFAELS